MHVKPRAVYERLRFNVESRQRGIDRDKERMPPGRNTEYAGNDGNDRHKMAV